MKSERERSSKKTLIKKLVAFCFPWEKLLKIYKSRERRFWALKLEVLFD